MDAKTERYVRNLERIKGRKIAEIMRKQKEEFARRLRNANKSTADDERFVDWFVEDTKEQVPDYLFEELPAVMREAAKAEIIRYADLLPEGYGLAFDIDTSPVSKYLNDMRDLMLSDRDGSISKTTRDELRQIMADGVDAGMGYGEIAEYIEATDPFVFSKARANLVAVNEIGRAAGFANHEPAVELWREGYGLVKKWKTSHDEKVRRTHSENEAAGWIPLDQPFPGTGDQYGPSSNDIRCRCTSTTRIVSATSADGKSLPIPENLTALQIRKSLESSGKIRIMARETNFTA